MYRRWTRDLRDRRKNNMNKLISIQEAVSKVKDGDVVMIGGFLGVGSPHKMIDALVAQGTKNLTLICNDSGFVDIGVGKLVVNKQFSKIIASHIGTNKETGHQMMEGETEVVLTPQGTLAEQIRAACYGLGGILTATGVGTKVAEGKMMIPVNGREYLLELPLHANVALIFANKGDKYGNLSYHGAAQNFNSVMAGAADITICEVDEYSEEALCPDRAETPGVFVNYIVKGKE